ncbi:MAG: hypothetical protein GX811_10685 [Lentisphaerae bacterium]|nr:hypothetical protein [Lentisphaerota bacterium]
MKIPHLLTILFILFLCAGRSDANTKKQIIGKLTVQNANVEVRLNGYPVWRVDATESGRHTSVARFNHLVQKGTNELKVAFYDANVLTGVQENGKDAKVTLDIEYETNSTFRVSDLKKRDVFEKINITKNSTYHFVIDEEYNHEKPWAAPPPLLTESDKIAIKSIIENVHAAFVIKDMETINFLFANFIECNAVSYGISVAEMVAGQTELYQHMFDSEEYNVLSLNRSPIRYNVDSIINLVTVSMEDGSAPITIELDNKTKARVPMAFSKAADGKWLIVR